MCWFIQAQVIFQKDTPHARAQVAALPPGCTPCGGTFPVLIMPAGICGCSYVKGQKGEGIVAEVVATLRHYLAQPPIKRVDVWWHWYHGNEDFIPELQRPITLEDFLRGNQALLLAPDVRYRLTDPAKYPFS